MCITEEKIPGGLASGKSLQDIAKHHNISLDAIKLELDKGIKIEMEHTTSESVAKEIATDHLWEDPYYYDKLEKIEVKESFSKAWWKKSLFEGKLEEDKRRQITEEFGQFCWEVLELTGDIDVLFTDNKNKTKTYAHYDPNNNSIVVYIGDRNLGDILRSLAHELVHAKQKQDNKLKLDSGKTGSSIENQANTIAGIIMREFGTLHPEIYE